MNDRDYKLNVIIEHLRAERDHSESALSKVHELNHDIRSLKSDDVSEEWIEEMYREIQEKKGHKNGD